MIFMSREKTWNTYKVVNVMVDSFICTGRNREKKLYFIYMISFVHFTKNYVYTCVKNIGQKNFVFILICPILDSSIIYCFI